MVRRNEQTWGSKKDGVCNYLMIGFMSFMLAKLEVSELQFHEFMMSYPLGVIHKPTQYLDGQHLVGLTVNNLVSSINGLSTDISGVNLRGFDWNLVCEHAMAPWTIW